MVCCFVSIIDRIVDLELEAISEVIWVKPFIVQMRKRIFERGEVTSQKIHLELERIFKDIKSNLI